MVISEKPVFFKTGFNKIKSFFLQKKNKNFKIVKKKCSIIK